MATKKEYNKKLKQLAILRAAEELFLNKPYGSITVNEIAANAGVTKRTVYSYYPSKLALFIQMFEDYLQKLHKQILTIAQKDLRPDKKLLQVMDVQFCFTRDNQAFMRLFWTLDSQEFDGELPQELTQSICLWNRDMLEKVTKIVKEGQDQGLIVTCSPELLVHVMSAYVKGIIFHTNKEAKLNIARVELQGLYELFLQLISKGIFPNPRAQRNISSQVDSPEHGKIHNAATV